MAKIPKNEQALVEVIDRAVVEKSTLHPKWHLSLGALGRKCERRAWLAFRWAKTENDYDGRTLRLIARQDRETEWFFELLRTAGCTVQTHTAGGSGFEFYAPGLGGHLRVPVAGIVKDIPEAPKTWHLAYFLVLSDEAFQDLCMEGFKKMFRREYLEVLIALQLANLERAVILAINRADDRLYSERIAADDKEAKATLGLAGRILQYQEPPAKLSDNADKVECTACDFWRQCHKAALPSVNCRTCANSTPVIGDGIDAQWHCARWDMVIPAEESRQAQPCHIYLPHFISWAEPLDMAETPDGLVAVQFQIKGEGEDRTFWHGEGVWDGQKAYSSEELQAIDPANIGLPDLESIRAGFDARAVDPVVAGLDDDLDDIPF